MNFEADPDSSRVGAVTDVMLMMFSLRRLHGRDISGRIKLTRIMFG